MTPSIGYDILKTQKLERKTDFFCKTERSIFYGKHGKFCLDGPGGPAENEQRFIENDLAAIITFGIYGIVVMSSVSNDINVVASRYDGKKTMHYCLLVFLVGPLTLGIGYIVWNHKLCNRIGAELQRRGIAYSFGARDYWLWNVLGALILVGPFVFLHKLFNAVNLMNADYNVKG